MLTPSEIPFSRRYPGKEVHDNVSPFPLCQKAGTNLAGLWFMAIAANIVKSSEALVIQKGSTFLPFCQGNCQNISVPSPGIQPFP